MERINGVNKKIIKYTLMPSYVLIVGGSLLCLFRIKQHHSWAASIFVTIFLLIAIPVLGLMFALDYKDAKKLGIKR